VLVRAKVPEPAQEKAQEKALEREQDLGRDSEPARGTGLD
jgi:hypothetical protein